MGDLFFKRDCPITVYISFGPVTECDGLNPLQLIVGLLGFAQDALSRSGLGTYYCLAPDLIFKCSWKGGH